MSNSMTNITKLIFCMKKSDNFFDHRVERWNLIVNQTETTCGNANTFVKIISNLCIRLLACECEKDVAKMLPAKMVRSYTQRAVASRIGITEENEHTSNEKNSTLKKNNIRDDQEQEVGQLREHQFCTHCCKSLPNNHPTLDMQTRFDQSI